MTRSQVERHQRTASRPAECPPVGVPALLLPASQGAAQRPGRPAARSARRTVLRTLVIGGFAAGAWLLGGAAAQAATAGPAVESHSTGGAVVSLVNGLGSGAVEPQTPTTSARTSADPTRRSTPLTGPTRRDNAGRPADRNTSGLLPTTVPTGLVPADAVRVPLDVLRAPVDAAATPVIDPLANQLAGHPGSGTLHHADRAATAAPGGSDGTVRGLVHHLAAALRPVDAPASGSLRPVATLVRPVVDPVVRALRPVTVPRHHAVRSVTVTPSPATTATTGRPGTANQVDPRPSAVDADPVGVSSHARASSAATSSRDLTAPAIRPARAGAAGTGTKKDAKNK